MKKRFIRLFMFATVLASMTTMNSCKDYDEGRVDDLSKELQRQNGELINQKTTLTNLIKAQDDSIQAMKAKFEAALANIKQCTCDPNAVTTKISQALDEYAAANPSITSAEANTIITNAIASYIAQHPGGIQQAEIENIVNQALNNYCTKAELQDVITALNNAHTAALNALNGKADKSDLDGKADKSEVEALTSTINQLNQAIVTAQAKADQAYDLANQAMELAKANGQSIEDLKTTINELSALANSLPGIITAWTDQMTQLTTQAADAYEAATIANNKADQLQALYDELSNRVNTIAAQGYDDSQLKAKDEQLASDIAALSDKVKDMATKQDIAAALAYAFDVFNACMAYTDEAVKVAAKEIEESVDNKLDDLKNTLENADEQLKQEIINNLTQAYQNADEQLKQEVINNLTQAYQDADGQLKQELQEAINQIESTFNLKLGDLQSAFEAADSQLQDQIDGLNADLNEVNDKIDNINSAISRLTEKASKQITSIELQGTINPVFGYASLPLGITSNILLGYYGANESKTYFPTTRTSDLVYKDVPLTDKDAEMLGSSVESFTAPGGTTFLGQEGNAGKIYLTVNPNTVDFTGTQFSLVNSLDEISGIKLGTLKPCKEKLTFGYTRADVESNSNNAFYEATATITEEGLPNVQLKLDEVLKQTVWDYLYAFKDKGVSAVKDINLTGMAQLLYNQFDGLMDANAVKASWTDQENTIHSAYSKYGIAAAAVHPLSYAFLYDQKFGKLKKINPISDAILSKIVSKEDLNLGLGTINISLDLGLTFPAYNIDMSGVNFNNFTVTVQDVQINDLGTLSFSVDVPESGTINGTSVDFTTKTLKFTSDSTDIDMTDYLDLTVMKDTLQAQLNSALKKCAADMTTSTRNSLQTMMGQFETAIESSVNSLMNDVQTQINTQLASKATDINNQINGQLTNVQTVINNAYDKANNKSKTYVAKVNRIINKVNALTNRLNNYLDNINAMTQVCLMYETNDGIFHVVSEDRMLATPLVGNGAIELLPTSLTAEIAVPAFKKFVAVTNVWKDGNSAQNGDAECRSVLEATNNKVYTTEDGEQIKYMNTVLEGGRYNIVFEPAASGYIYEIFYSALDYTGKISQRKFYVSVK